MRMVYTPPDGDLGCLFLLKGDSVSCERLRSGGRRARPETIDNAAAEPWTNGVVFYDGRDAHRIEYRSQTFGRPFLCSAAARRYLILP